MPKTELLDKTKLAKPKLFKLFMLNDDFTTMDFVISVLIDVFRFDFAKACDIMLIIHNEGEALCGVYTQEIALSKQDQVAKLAANADFPLKTRIEEE